jgi:uncharacterized protein with NAD-binding domain and iron-sulfur cluster
LSEYRNMLALLDRLGTRDKILWQEDRLLRLCQGAAVTDMHLSALPAPLHLLPSMAKVRQLSWRDKISNRSIMKLAMQLDEETIRELDDVSAESLLLRYGVSRAFIDWFWATACITVMNVPLQQCSAGALLRVFSQLIGRRHYKIGFATCGLADLFVPGILQLLAREGGRVEAAVAVQRVDVSDAKVTGLLLADGRRVTARQYVAAVPPQSLRSILPDTSALQPLLATLGSFQPSPYISSYLWFDRKLTQDMFWTRIWNPHDLNSDFYDLSNIRPGGSRCHSLIASNIIYSHRAQTLSDEQIIARTREEIAERFPDVQRAQVTHASVHRIPMAVACPLPGTEQQRPPTVTAIGNLLLAGDWTRTLLPSCMESAVHSGFAAAEVIWRSIGAPRSLTLPKRPIQDFARLTHWFSHRA